VTETLQHAASEARRTYAIISGLASSISVISLTAKLFHIGLAPLLNEFIDFYRKFARAVISPILYFLPFTAPEWYRDAFVGSFIFMLLFFRSSYLAWPGRSAQDDMKNTALLVLLSFLFSIPLFGIILLVIVPFSALSSDRVDRGRLRARLFLISIATALAAATAFFVLNSQL
jgi:hypothetical protein